MKIKRINPQTEEIEIALPYYFRTDGWTYKSYHRLSDEKIHKQTSITIMEDNNYAAIVCNASHLEIPSNHTIITSEEFCEAFDKALKIQEEILFNIAGEGGKQ